MAAAARSAAGADIAHIAVSSLANEQFCYLTTPEEYSLQRYEGGNTLYGPLSQPFVAGCVARLAADLARGPVAEPLATRTFAFAAHRYLAQRRTGVAVPANRSARRRSTTRRAPRTATGSSAGAVPSPGELAWHEPLVRVEAATADGGWTPVADDQGYHLGVVHLGSGRADGHRYATRWHTGYLGPGPCAPVRPAGARDGAPVASGPFT